MLASTSYPLLDAFLTILFIFGFVLWIWLVIAIFSDIFRSDQSGVSKVLWVLAVIFLPLLGVLMYLLVHGRDMQSRADRAAQQQQDSFRQYVQSVAADGGTDSADQLNRLANLRDRGVINNEEFERQKAKVLA